MIEGDSIEYELIERCCNLIKNQNPLTCEVGVRLGKGSEIILKNLKNKNHWHIGIDPYGDLEYEHFDIGSGIEHTESKPEYTNSMKKTVLQNLDFDNYTIFQMTDDDYMNLFYNGVPIYNKKRIIRNDYDLVVLDGPHKTFNVLKELIFFGERLNKSGFLILDDYNTYKFTMLLTVAELMKIKPMHVGDNKMVLRKY
tara:strand:- start:55 stop:645 length:591 start_codon:yes stop_codon:yes gene_type:complete